ncbi:PqqD family peptide modification chaperone [Clostridiales bacterium FE2010]|nr:PqqD family peptide modification chaperone [Clostridiales bacterium FE2010]
MKSKYSFEKMELDGEIVAVPVGEGAAELHAVLNVNEEAMRILELLQEETTEENIVAQLMKEYEGKKEEIAPLVSEYIRQLFQEGLLEE